MNGKHRPRLKDIAAKVGLTSTSVSMALRNHPSIPVATRERVQRIAQELGYRPDPVVATLMAQVRARRRVQQSETLAFVSNFPTRDGWRESSTLFVRYFEGASERAEQLGYRLEEFWSREPGMSAQRLSRILHTRNIRGILVGPFAESRGDLMLEWSHFAGATFGASLRKPDLPRAVPDTYHNMLLALDRLKALGYKRWGVVIDEEVDRRVNHSCLSVLYFHQQAAKPSDRVPPLLKAMPTEEDCLAWFRAHQPDVILTTGTFLLRSLRKHGVRVPEDVGYAQIQREENDECAGIEQNPRIVGRAAVNLVVGQLHRNEFGVPAYAEVVMVKGEWVDGPSVRMRSR